MLTLADRLPAATRTLVPISLSSLPRDRWWSNTSTKRGRFQRVPERHRLHGLRRQPLEHPLQRRVQRVVLVAQRLAAALQQPLVEAGLAQHLLVPLAVHQQLEDVGHCQLQVQGVLCGGGGWVGDTGGEGLVHSSSSYT